MAQEYRGEHTLGIDYGTDSCRAAVIDAHNGAEIASAVVEYPRWGQGLFCSPTRNVFRQHPLDSATEEAAAINRAARTWEGVDFIKYEGGIYSSEWFWAKIAHLLRLNARPPDGHSGPGQAKAKPLRHVPRVHVAQFFRRLPPIEFLSLIHTGLPRIAATLGGKTWTSDQACGALIAEWGSRLHLTAGTPMVVGSYGAHMGAAGGGVLKGVLVKVISTFTRDMRVGPAPKGEGRLVLGMLIKRTVYPRPAFHSKYATLYSRYRSLGSCAEKEFS